MIEYLLSYLLGSINFAYIFGKLARVDISKYGDANLGATNLYYAYYEKYHKKSIAFILFLLAGLLDILKGMIPTLLFGPIVGTFSVLGHCFSIFSIIKNRKVPSGVGMASTIGWALVTDYRLILIALIIGIPLLMYFRDVFKLERGHSYYPFIIALTGWVYTVLYGISEVTYGLLFIVLITSIARFIRLKNIIKEKCKS